MLLAGLPRPLAAAEAPPPAAQPAPATTAEPTPDLPPGGQFVPTFQDVSQTCGLPDTPATTVNWLDLDHDRYPDLLIDACRLYRNGGPPTFRFQDVTEAAGLAGGKPGAALAIDLDNDGWTDIVTTAGRLWHNRGDGTFADLAAEAGFRPSAKAGVLGAGDIDGDGFADLYVATQEDWNNGNPKYYPHELWHNDGGRHFTEIGAAAGIDRSTYGRTVLLADVDGDGRQDIFVANYRLTANLLWHNRGDNRFEDVARVWGVAGRNRPDLYYDPVVKQRFGPRWGHTIGACWVDLDNDGDLDLFTANLVHKYVGPSNLEGMNYDIRGYVCDDSAIYRRDRGVFVDARLDLGVPTRPLGGPAVFRGDELWANCVPGDVNNDGWADVFVPQIYNQAGAKSLLFVNTAGQGLVDAGWVAGLQRVDTCAGAWADIDGDGNLDLATAGRAGKDQPVRLTLFRGLGIPDGTPRHWLKVRLRPGSQRRTVLGTEVRVQWNGRQALQLVGAGTGSYGQQNEPTLHAGLGTDPVPIVTLTVRWPDGTLETTTTGPDTTLVIDAP